MDPPEEGQLSQEAQRQRRVTNTSQNMSRASLNGSGADLHQRSVGSHVDSQYLGFNIAALGGQPVQSYATASMQVEGGVIRMEARLVTENFEPHPDRHNRSDIANSTVGTTQDPIEAGMNTAPVIKGRFRVQERIIVPPNHNHTLMSGESNEDPAHLSSQDYGQAN